MVHQGLRQVEVADGEVRRRLDRAAVGLDLEVRAALPAVEAAEIEAGPMVARAQFLRLPVGGDRVLHPPRLIQQNGQVEVGLAEFRVR